MVDEQVAIPLAVRLALGRAAAQVLADQCNADVLHIKGNAVDSSLQLVERSGTDVDILVRPGHVNALDRALRDHGWTVRSSFTYGSPFEHAQTYWNRAWGYLDLHRRFPGVRRAPDAAFDALWRGRLLIDVGSVACPVPDAVGQTTILILNSARSGGLAGTALEQTWVRASPQFRSGVEQLVGALDAPTAFAAAFGRLEEHEHEPDYELWRVVTQGGSRVDEWRARAAAAPTRIEALKILLRAPRVNIEQLGHQLGHAPSWWEVGRALGSRVVRAVRDLRVRARRRS